MELTPMDTTVVPGSTKLEANTVSPAIIPVVPIPVIVLIPVSVTVP